MVKVGAFIFMRTPLSVVTWTKGGGSEVYELRVVQATRGNPYIPGAHLCAGLSSIVVGFIRKLKNSNFTQFAEIHHSPGQ
jgi:hypothetical protein